jgi:hypothetical protein
MERYTVATLDIGPFLNFTELPFQNLGLFNNSALNWMGGHDWRSHVWRDGNCKAQNDSQTQRHVQSNLIKRERIKRDFALSGTQYFASWIHTKHDVEKGFCSKRDCLAVILTSRVIRFDCSVVISLIEAETSVAPRGDLTWCRALRQAFLHRTFDLYFCCP